MRKFFSALAALALAWCPPAATAQPAPVPADSAPAAELSAADAVILGVVEGVTEYLPISSTGHLIIANRALHLDSDRQLSGRDGRPLWYRAPSARHPAGVPLTLALAANTYTVVIQFGAIAAVALLYWPQFLSMLRGVAGRDPAGLRLLITIAIAFVPAAVVGLLCHDWIEARLFGVGPVIASQAVGAFFMLYAEYWRRRHIRLMPDEPAGLNLAPHAAAGIGLLQCLSLWPGMSRSMTTIVGGYFARLSPRRAAEFSFILGFVTLTAATLYKSHQSGAAMIQVFGWSHVLLGCVVATVTAVLCVRWLVGWLTRHGLAAFAYYRLAIAALLGALLAAGYLQ